MCSVHMVAWWLLFVGGLNWGLIGIANFNVVARIFGSVTWLERLIYVLVGISAIAMLMKHSCKMCKDCMHEEGKGMMGSSTGSGQAGGAKPMGGM